MSIFVATVDEGPIKSGGYFEISSQPILFHSGSEDTIRKWKALIEKEYESGVEVDIFGDGYMQKADDWLLEITYHSLEEYVNIFGAQRLLENLDYEFINMESINDN